MLLSSEVFKTVVNSVPIVSIDLVIKNKNKYLLGRRVNNPAKGYFFTAGGRIIKNETLNIAMNRIALCELSLKLSIPPKFVGVFDHFYADSIFNNISIHYVNLAYECEVEKVDLMALPKEQHSEYKWFSKVDLMESEQVHQNVKNYFQNEGDYE
jgi:colanic acid biosynthesis protein WcaH